MVLYLGCVIGLRYKVTSIALGCEDKYSTIAPFAKIRVQPFNSIYRMAFLFVKHFDTHGSVDRKLV